MQSIITKFKLLFTGILLAAIFCTSSTFALADQQASDHKPITQSLIALLEKDPALKSLLEKSIAEARKSNPDLKTNPAQNLADYYDYIDEASELIPQVVINNPKNLIRDQILQSICYFYFLIDQPLSELDGKGLFNNRIQYYGPFSSWLRDFANAWGQFLDTKASWSEKTYKEFYNDPRFGMKKGWYGTTNKWTTFNGFFSRFLESPSQRPIASPGDKSIVSSPADSVPQGVWTIDGDGKIHIGGGLKVKLTRYFSVEDLVGKESKYKDAFNGGVLTHNFLNVNDYHRYHFPVGGTVKEVSNLVQNVALEVAWSPDEGKYVPIDSIGWQFSQTRGVTIIDTGKHGLVALIPMGMAQVSSVNFENNVKVGSNHKKGDMLGDFLFGGSDFVMLFQKNAGFELTVPADHKVVTKAGSDRGRRVTTYQHLLMGEKLGVLQGGK
jgi:phosphatidylserine decarboxylase